MGRPLVGIIMGSESDWPVMKETAITLEKLDVPFEVRIISAHRSPSLTRDYARKAEKRGINVIIAGAGGAAHLSGVIASETVLPVIGVPMETRYLKGRDSLYSTVQMPRGVPVATMAIGKAGAINAAILSASILSIKSPVIKRKLKNYRKRLTEEVIRSDRKLRKKFC